MSNHLRTAALAAGPLACAVLSSACATTVLGRGEEPGGCEEPGRIAINQRVASTLDGSHSCRSTRDTWFDEYTFDVPQEQWLRFVLTSPKEVRLTLRNTRGVPVEQVQTDGGGRALDFAVDSERLEKGSYSLQVGTMRSSTNSAPYTLTLLDGKYELEGSCWPPEAQRMSLGREETLAPDEATCALDGGERAVIRKFELTDVRDVAITASAGSKLRFLNDEGTTIVWADSRDRAPARFARTLVPGTYTFVVGWPEGASVELGLHAYPSLVPNPPVPEFEAKERPGCEDPEKRTHLEFGRSYVGRIDDESCHVAMEHEDYDTYVLEVPKDGRYRLTVKAPAFHPYVKLLDYRGEFAASSGMTLEGDSLFDGHIFAGTYELRVYQSDGAAEGSYELRVEIPEAS